ncbi:uncharacterized protein LOC144589895 [Rhinoraja longicauda]
MRGGAELMLSRVSARWRFRAVPLSISNRSIRCHRPDRLCACASRRRGPLARRRFNVRSPARPRAATGHLTLQPSSQAGHAPLIPLVVGELQSLRTPDDIMAESGDCGGDSVTSTSTKQKGGKLTQAGKFLKRIWPRTSSKKDGQNTGITTEKQSRMESRTSMECEPAEEEREQCQPRGRGIGDMVHSPGTDPSGEIHHDREISSKESSSLIQGAEQQNMVIPIHTMAEDGNRTAAPVTPTTRTDTDSVSILLLILVYRRMVTELGYT